jgi:tetratricopeptide (TPR) repeat protein
MAGNLQEGIRLFRLKRWDLSIAELLQVSTNNFSPEQNVELAYYLGLCYTKLERYDDALLYLEQVVTSGIDPLRVFQCRMTLAYIYTITNRSKLAEFELNLLLKRGFESAQIFTTLAYGAFLQKQIDKSLEYYRKALEIDTNNPTALNGLGYILADQGIDPPKGLVYCKKAVDLRPQNPAYLDSLGWAYYKNGELLEARNWLRRAFEVAPQHPDIKQHIRVIIGEAT